MRTSRLILAVIAFGVGATTVVYSQDHLEPADDFWSVYDLRLAAEARDTLLKDFSRSSYARTICVPEDGDAWAVSLEQQSDSSFLIRSAHANGDLGLVNPGSGSNYERLRRTRVLRASRPINQQRAHIIMRVFFDEISTARYPRAERQMLHGSTFYFYARDTKPIPNRVSAQVFAPIDDKMPKRLVNLSYAMLQFGLADSPNADRLTNTIDSLVARMEQ